MHAHSPHTAGQELKHHLPHKEVNMILGFPPQWTRLVQKHNTGGFLQKY